MYAFVIFGEPKAAHIRTSDLVCFFRRAENTTHSWPFRFKFLYIVLHSYFDFGLP